MSPVVGVTDKASLVARTCARNGLITPSPCFTSIPQAVKPFTIISMTATSTALWVLLLLLFLVLVLLLPLLPPSLLTPDPTETAVVVVATAAIDVVVVVVIVVTAAVAVVVVMAGEVNNDARASVLINTTDCAGSRQRNNQS